MKIIGLIVIVSLFITGTVFAEEIALPKPDLKGEISVEKAINERKSVRNFARGPISLEELSQILWAAGGKTVDGISGPTRAYPSAGAIYPLEIYVLVRDVTGLEPGIYYYNWMKGSIKLIRKGNYASAISKAALDQKMIRDASITLIVMALYQKESRMYGQRGIMRYISMDAGHMGQNVHLQAQSLGLGTVMVGAFLDAEVKKIIGSRDETPIYIMPVGRPVK